MLPSLPHLPGAGSPQAPGAGAPGQILVLRAAVESVGQLFPQGRERGGLTEGKIPVRNTETGINYVGKVPKRVGVPSGVPALAGIEQHRPILTECTKLHLKHSSFLSRIY